YQESGPDVQAWLDYEQVVASVSEQLAQMAEAAQRAGAGADALADAERAAIQVINAAARARDQKLAALAKERDIVGRITRSHQEELRTLSMSSRELAVHNALRMAAAEAARQFADGLRDSADLTQEEIDAIANSTEALHDASEAARQLEEILSRYDRIGFH